MNKALFLLLFCLPAVCLQAQDFTGRWEGIMTDEFLQVNIVQQKDKLCGYTYDFLLANKRDYCKAQFSGVYNAANETLTLTGTGMLENSGTHVLMKIWLWHNEADPEDVLTGTVRAKGLQGLLQGTMPEFKLTRVSGKYSTAGVNISPCFPVPEKKKEKNKSDTVVQAPAPIKVNTPAPALPLPEKTAPVVLPGTLQGRQQKEQAHIIINDLHLVLKLYDNGIVDGDTITVYYNGRLLVSHQLLSEKPVELTIDMDSTVTLHTITLYAENLGSIPPNTALIIAEAGGKRYELFAKADLNDNAVLVFEYRKKQ